MLGNSRHLTSLEINKQAIFGNMNNGASSVVICNCHVAIMQVIVLKDHEHGVHKHLTS